MRKIDNFEKGEVLSAQRLNVVLDEIELNMPISRGNGNHTHASLRESSSPVDYGLLEIGLINYIGGLKITVNKFTAWASDGTSYELATDLNRNYKTVELTTAEGNKKYHILATVDKILATLTLSFSETVPPLIDEEEDKKYYRAIGNVTTNSSATMFTSFDWTNRNWIGGDIHEGGGGASEDVFVKTTANDTTPNYLNEKINAGTGLLKTIENPGNEENLLIEIDPNILVDENVKVSNNDTATGYLNSKLNVDTSSGLTKTISNQGANEVLLIGLDVESLAGNSDFDHLLGSNTHTDVIITSPVNEDVLSYNSATNIWTNRTLTPATLLTNDIWWYDMTNTTVIKRLSVNGNGVPFDALGAGMSYMMDNITLEDNKTTFHQKQYCIPTEDPS